MSFGWSAGDIIDGLKVVWDIWQAVSDGPLNAEYQARQFFDEFHLIFTRLDEWENRKATYARDDQLTRSHRKLREECTLFIKYNFSLIQQVNPSTKANRIDRSTWLQKAQFSQSQIIALYKKVSWPSQRETVAKLRQKLELFLTLAAMDVALDTNDIVRDIRATNADLIATNYKLVTSHLDLVASVTTNLKRITFPLEPGRQQEGIDYPMLRQFERSLRPPQPIGLIKDAPGQLQLPWQNGQKKEELKYAAVRPLARHTLESSTSEQEEARGFMAQRLANLSMRRKHVETLETLETITESGSQETMRPSIQHLLQLLKNMRNYIGDAVGVLNNVPQNEVSLAVVDPGDALKKELEAWDTMKERIEREILHPPPSKVFTRASQTMDGPVQSTASSQPIAIPIRSPRGSANRSPRASYDGWMGPDDSPSPSRSPGSLSSSPNDTRRLSSNSGGNSTASMSRRSSIRSEHEYHVHLYYPKHAIHAVIRSISRNDEGDVQSISSISSDGITKFRHSADFDNEDPKIETSMIPFIDNNHVVDGPVDRTPKFRLQFKGTHHLKISVKVENKGEVTVAAHPCPPIYKFLNEHDFLEFQQLLLNKNIRRCADVMSIKSLMSEAICRVGTVRIVFEPISRIKSILYFQHMNLAQDQKAGFVEWPVSTFKDPKEPSKKSKTLTLESHDGKALFSGRGIIRRGTQGSVNTIASTESSAGPAFARIQERSSTSGGKSIKGLIFEFYDHQECQKFWEEFRKREPSSFHHGSDLGLNFDSGFSVPLPSPSP